MAADKKHEISSYWSCTLLLIPYDHDNYIDSLGSIGTLLGSLSPPGTPLSNVMLKQVLWYFSVLNGFLRKMDCHQNLTSEFLDLAGLGPAKPSFGKTTTNTYRPVSARHGSRSFLQVSIIMTPWQWHAHTPHSGKELSIQETHFITQSSSFC